MVQGDPVWGREVKQYLEQALGIGVLYYRCPKECSAVLPEKMNGQNFCLITESNFQHGSSSTSLIDSLQGRELSFFSIVITNGKSVEDTALTTRGNVFYYLTRPFKMTDLHQLVAQGLESKFNYKVEVGGTADGFIANGTDGLQDGQKGERSCSKGSLGGEGPSWETKDPPLQTRPTTENSNTILRSRLELRPVQEDDIYYGMIGRSPQMKCLFEQIKKVASVDSTVLITGSSGTGKELVAQAVHDLSHRSSARKVNVNCGAIPQGLLESELFGHTKGAFTGAISDHKGLFEQAHRGSIFLDEIGDMPALLQVKLLRVLQTKQIEPIGGNRSINVDVRVIAATHRNLEKLVTEGKFREDLYSRFNVIPIKVPALKDRREDILVLISHFLSLYVNAGGSNSIHFDQRSLELLVGHDWPGNIRELENTIERLVILCGGSTVRQQDLPVKICQQNTLATSSLPSYENIIDLPEEGINIKKVLSNIENSLIIQALARTKGNKNRASKLLGLNRTTLIEKMKKKNIGLLLE